MKSWNIFWYFLYTRRITKECIDSPQDSIHQSFCANCKYFSKKEKHRQGDTTLNLLILHFNLFNSNDPGGVDSSVNPNRCTFHFYLLPLIYWIFRAGRVAGAPELLYPEQDRYNVKL